MPAVAALALTLALAPAPSPSPAPSAPAGPVTGLLGGLGEVVDGLLGLGGGSSTTSPSAAPTTPGPSATSIPDPVVPPTGVPVTPGGAVPGAPAGGATAGTPGTQGGAPARVGSWSDTDDPVVGAPVPRAPDGRAPAPTGPDGLAAPTAVDDDALFRLTMIGLAVAVLAVQIMLLVRRRRERPAPAAAAPPVAGPVPPAALDATGDNVTRLPTNLNAIYELGRLDERLAQERERRS
ncbi:hypothetical protein ACFOOK_14290 [Micromonospora krabiensis]|uniref:Uncharacterized protein n=1 Tax=Micromonospora krabiensis TaxID=307121 RepID=A0A1C3N1F7_9ACTN|nr:hypothetical protein [Micromonospora krabiensis]SBV26396.1 hypothetical protein GA0070620_1884 [Micromonospora krabiensis]